MKFAVLGTGVVGRNIAERLVEVGHEATIGTRSPEGTLARTERAYDGATYAEWAAAHPTVGLGTFADATATAEIVVNASSGGASLEVLAQAGAANFAGKVVLDIANPLDFSKGMPPTLFVKDDDSLGERIQRAFPEARVVKTLNTVTAPLMVRPATLSESTTVFVSGNDADAKHTATELLHSFGHEDVIDLGDITTARGPEMFLALWIRTMGALGTAAFNVKVVR